MTPPTAVLTTSRLILRPCRAQCREDTDLIVRTYNDPFIGAWGFAKVGIRTHEDVGKKHHQHGPRNKPETCTRWMQQYGEVADVMYHLVYLKDDTGEAGDYIGFVGNSFRTEVEWPDFGYALFEQYNGRGYASEASIAALNWWREEAGVKEMWIGTFDDNVASQKCARKIGFEEGGELKIVYGDGEKSEGVTKGRGYILPGMKWPEGGLIIGPAISKKGNAG